MAVATMTGTTAATTGVGDPCRTLLGEEEVVAGAMEALVAGATAAPEEEEAAEAHLLILQDLPEDLGAFHHT